MDQLIRKFGFRYFYGDNGYVDVGRNNLGPMDLPYSSLWSYHFTVDVHMVSRRLHALTELLGMGLLTKEQARKMVGLND